MHVEWRMRRKCSESGLPPPIRACSGGRDHLIRIWDVEVSAAGSMPPQHVVPQSSAAVQSHFRPITPSVRMERATPAKLAADCQ